MRECTRRGAASKAYAREPLGLALAAGAAFRGKIGASARPRIAAYVALAGRLLKRLLVHMARVDAHLGEELDELWHLLHHVDDDAHRLDALHRRRVQVEVEVARRARVDVRDGRGLHRMADVNWLLFKAEHGHETARLALARRL